MKGQGRARFFFGISSFISALMGATGIMTLVFVLVYTASYFGGVNQFLYDIVYTYPWYILVPCALVVSMFLVGLVTTVIFAFKGSKIKSVTSLLLENSAKVGGSIMALIALLTLLEFSKNFGLNYPLIAMLAVGSLLTMIIPLICSDFRHKSTPRSAKRRAISVNILSLIYIASFIVMNYFKYINIINGDFLKSNVCLFIILASTLLAYLLHVLAVIIYPKRHILEVAGIADKPKVEEDAEEEEEEPTNASDLYIIKAHEYENRYKITEINVPVNYSKIEEYAFAGCRNMRVAIIPSSIQEIGDMAFSGCTSLKEMTYLGTCEQFKAMRRGQGWIDTTLIVSCLDGALKVDMVQGGKRK